MQDLQRVPGFCCCHLLWEARLVDLAFFLLLQMGLWYEDPPMIPVLSQDHSKYIIGWNFSGVSRLASGAEWFISTRSPGITQENSFSFLLEETPFLYYSYPVSSLPSWPFQWLPDFHWQHVSVATGKHLELFCDAVRSALLLVTTLGVESCCRMLPHGVGCWHLLTNPKFQKQCEFSMILYSILFLAWESNVRCARAIFILSVLSPKPELRFNAEVTMSAVLVLSTSYTTVFTPYVGAVRANSWCTHTDLCYALRKKGVVL